MLLSVTLVCAIVFVLGRFKYDVVLDLAQARVTVGDRAVGRLDVRNASSRALLPSVMELPVGTGTAAFPVPRLRGGGTHEEIFTIPTRRRSVITVGPVKSVRADPLGLLRREMTWTDEQEVFVHPRVKNLTGSSTGFLKDLEGRVTNDITNSDVNFHALRDYVAGDDRRHIHWKTTARTGQLMVQRVRGDPAFAPRGAAVHARRGLRARGGVRARRERVRLAGPAGHQGGPRRDGARQRGDAAR